MSKKGKKGKKVFKKQEQIEKLADTLEVTQKEARKIYDIFCKLFEQGIRENDYVKFGGFVSFSKSEQNGRNYRNPKTGETVFKPAHTRIKAKICKSFSL